MVEGGRLFFWYVITESHGAENAENAFPFPTGSQNRRIRQVEEILNSFLKDLRFL